MKKKSIPSKNRLSKVFLIVLLALVPVILLVFTVIEAPLYLQVIFVIYLIIICIFIDDIIDILLLETEHTKKEYDTEQNTDHTEKDCKIKVNIAALKS